MTRCIRLGTLNQCIEHGAIDIARGASEEMVVVRFLLWMGLL